MSHLKLSLIFMLNCSIYQMGRRGEGGVNVRPHNQVQVFDPGRATQVERATLTDVVKQ